MADGPADSSGSTALAERLAAAVSTLGARDARVLTFRYGLADRRRWTLEEIGGQLGVSRERVRQLHTRALGRLRRQGQRELQAGRLEAPSAALIRLATKLVGGAGDLGVANRVARLLHNELGWVDPLVGGFLLAYLAGATREQAKARAAEARGAYQAAAKELREQQILLSPSSPIGRFRALLHAAVLWPPPPYATAERQNFSRQRNLSQDRGFRSHASDKLGRKVQCQAGEEPLFYARLDRLDTVAWYQEQPLRIPYRLDGRPLNYYPDVLIGMMDGRGVVAEIKPGFGFGLLSNLVKWVALWEYCSRCGYGMFVGNRYRSIQQVMAQPVPEMLERALLAALAAAPLDWPACKAILDQHGARSSVLTTVALRNGLAIREQPFRLVRALGEHQDRILGLLQRWREQSASPAGSTP